MDNMPHGLTFKVRMVQVEEGDHEFPVITENPEPPIAVPTGGNRESTNLVVKRQHRTPPFMLIVLMGSVLCTILFGFLLAKVARDLKLQKMEITKLEEEVA